MWLVSFGKGSRNEVPIKTGSWIHGQVHGLHYSHNPTTVSGLPEKFTFLNRKYPSLVKADYLGFFYEVFPGRKFIILGNNGTSFLIILFLLRFSSFYCRFLFLYLFLKRIICHKERPTFNNFSGRRTVK